MRAGNGGQVLLQLLPVDEAAAAATAAGLQWLTDGERARLAEMRSPERRENFLAGHWQGRQLAAHWLSVDAVRLAWQTLADGRPCLILDGQPTALSLSISHSGGWLALALSDAPVGVDVELPQRSRDWLALARFVFSPAETQRLLAESETTRIALFHTLWTLKEARGKRSGEGLLPRAATEVTALPCANEEAEAFSWQFAQGALALALTSKTSLQWHAGTRLETATAWRFG